MGPLQILEFPGTGRRKRVNADFGTEYVQRLSARDPDTELHFVGYFEPLLRLRLQKRFRDDTRADDFAQETLLRVLKTVRENPHSIEHPERLGAYVNAICNHVILEGYRGDGRYRGASDGNLEVADPSADIERSLLSAERQLMVRTILYAMPPKDRVLLTEVFLEEQDKDDICTRHGVDRQYLRVLLFRALGRFRIELGKKV